MADVLRSHGITDGLRLWERGVDTSRFNPALRSLEWRRTQGVDDDDVLVSFIGRLVWEKGLRVFADVIEGLKRRGVRHRSMVVGVGPALEELVKRLPDTIFTGYLQGKDLSRAYASSDLFLFPSDTETFGNVTLEAMASGLPSVCADATGSRTLVENGETGLLVPAGNAAAFLDAVHHLVDDAPERRRMGIGALGRARQYEWNTILSRMVGFYDEILQPHGGSALDRYHSRSSQSNEDTVGAVLVH
jgi:glycosyltransferase involved in cell wall biosynthesis